LLRDDRPEGLWRGLTGAALRQNSSGMDRSDLRDELAERAVCLDFSAVTEEWLDGLDNVLPEKPLDVVVNVFDAFIEPPPSFDGFESQLPSALGSLLLFIPSTSSSLIVTRPRR
jgi:hypothetical protein